MYGDQSAARNSAERLTRCQTHHQEMGVVDGAATYDGFRVKILKIAR